MESSSNRQTTVAAVTDSESGFDDCSSPPVDLETNGVLWLPPESEGDDEPASSKEEFTKFPSDSRSILVFVSSWCVWKGTPCERAHFCRIEYYGNFDKPLGQYLRDHLFDQSYRCSVCDMPSEAHGRSYTHRQGTLTVSVKKLPEILLPGESEGKIWLWQKCLRCPQDNQGFPLTTPRVVMSDDAWGLSFGKFLDLSFSDHAAASSVASCGHSLHRDCLRFYGFGKMVGCFRYASIDVHSVYLPPSKLDFNNENQEWIQQEMNEVTSRAELLFSEILNAIRVLIEKRSVRQPQIADLEGMFLKEKEEFEESHQKGQPVVDILEINRLRRQLCFQSYAWERRLVFSQGHFPNMENLPDVLEAAWTGETGYRVHISSFGESDARNKGARLLLPVGINDTVIPVYDDEPTSIISYALVSHDYIAQLSDELEDSTVRKTMHPQVSFAEDGPLAKVKYTVTCYHAKPFEDLRRMCCLSEMDFVRSLSRCNKWESRGGSVKTLDDRFTVKQVTKTELESFMKFAPAYFEYLSGSISSESPTCLAKILGIYQVSSKHLKMDVVVMENLLLGRNVTTLYDLKGSTESRYNPDSSGSNKVLLDQNLIESMTTSPIFVGNKAKRLLERAVWSDTAFLSSVDVMDYSLLVGVDEEKHELLVGIIDYMRQYTWDLQFQTWINGIFNWSKDVLPTIIPPKQYKTRFRKGIDTYFQGVPDQWI